jgi:hypothetical protein
LPKILNIGRRMMKKTGSLLTLALLILLTVPLVFSSYPAYAKITYADTYVNATTGNDANSGNSATAPKKTIAAAIDYTATSGTIHIAAGTYNEYGLHLSDTINMVGAGALTTIIDGKGLGLVLEISSAPSQRNTLSGLTIRGGAPSGSDPGGGIYISVSHIVTINDCAITGNYRGSGSGSRAGAGGGICNDSGALYMNRCTVSGNTALNAGGGVATYQSAGDLSGHVEMTNCTIYGNTVTGAGSTGGGLFCATAASMHLLNVTIAGNRATGSSSAGGGFSDGSLSSTYLKNCIVANNTATLSQHGNQYQSLASGVYSLGNNLGGSGVSYFNQPSDLNNVDPQLGALQNNGGPTSTCAITRSSPAYNRGDLGSAPATDQRGFPRPIGICSIGAYEVAVTAASVNTNLGAVSFSIDSGALNRLAGVKVTDTQCSTPAGYYLPYGLFSFNISGLTAGQTVRVTIKFPHLLPHNFKYFKCINGSMVDCTSLTTRIDDYTLVLAITDGGRGDADGLANGTIADPGGPAIPVASAATVYGQGSMSTITQQAPVSLPSVSVKSASLSATSVSPGTPVTVTADVVNTGMVNGSSSIKVYVNGQEESSQGVTVNSGSNTPLTFTVSRNEPGTYTVYVGGTNAGSFVVDQFADPNLIPIISGALIVFAFVIGLIYITRRRQA